MLLLLCVVYGNIAGLLLARAESRIGEIGIRLSLGASRWRLIKQLCAENLPLAVLGGTGAAIFTLSASPLLLRFLPTLGVGAYSPPVVLDVTPDIRVFFLVAVSLLTMSLFGLAPVLRASRFDLHRQMLKVSRSVSSASALTVVSFQVALTVLLLTGSLLVCETFWSLSHLNPGFDQDHVIETKVDPWDAGYSESQAAALFTDVERRVTELPGVRAVSFAGMELMRGIGTKRTVVPQGSHLHNGTSSIQALTELRRTTLRA